jgi:cell division protein FtsZ
MMQNNLPPGWSEDRVRRILECYKSDVESDIAEGETVCESEDYILIKVPSELAPDVHNLIAQHESRSLPNVSGVVGRALKYVEKDVDNTTDLAGTPRILVVGCGGAGNNTTTRMYDLGIGNAEIIAINTDRQDLDECRADKKILVGKSITRGLGAGGDPEVGRRAAELARDTLTEMLADADLVFVTAGMGGGTGTGVAPVVADIARGNGAIVVGIVSTPLHVERARTIKAETGIRELIDAAHTVIVLDNNSVSNYLPNLQMAQVFSVTDQLISETVRSISDTITKPSLINLDYADIRTVMNCGGVAVMLFSESKTRDTADDVVRGALHHPMLDVDYRGATGCLVHITGGSDLSLRDAEEIASSLTYELSPHANVIWGASIEEDFKGMRVIAIMTGIESPQIVGHKVSDSSYDTAPLPDLVRLKRRIIDFIK